jgi:hypothetical protein
VDVGAGCLVLFNERVYLFEEEALLRHEVCTPLFLCKSAPNAAARISNRLRRLAMRVRSRASTAICVGPFGSSTEMRN